ncbi:MAG: TIGR02757 family protein [Tannerella sp.]|nr:TIGR02757 family protein [Tannerella sp.]
MMDSIKVFLDEQLARTNTPAFAANDPVQFPRRYARLQDIEVVSFAVATIAWGNRRMILNNAARMLSNWGDSPYDYVMNEGYRALGKANVHRTFFEPDLAYMLRGFRHIFTSYGSVENLLVQREAGQAGAPAWFAASVMQAEMATANGGRCNGKCFPANIGTTALKRINMALRWLVRRDGIVDLGVWRCIEPHQLYIPLDVHAGNTARALGLLQRKSNDRKAVEELTERLRAYCPEDPAKYDFALFGAGIDRTVNTGIVL